MHYIKNLPIILLVIACTVMSFACSNGKSPVEPIISRDFGMTTDISDSEITSANILGAYELTIDIDSMTADLIPKRQSAIGESWSVSGLSYFTVRPCVDCFKLSNLRYDNGRIVVKFDIRHPFEKGNPANPPSGKNRLDLDVFDLALVIAPKPFTTVNYPLLNAEIPAYLIENPDGYTIELSEVTGSSVALPYVLVIDDSAVSPPSNTFNKFEMGASTDFEVVFPLMPPDAPDQAISFDLYLTFGYGWSAVLANRFDPKYYNPEFNRKAAWKVDVTPPNRTSAPQLGNTWNNNDNSTEFDVTIKVYDWQIGATVNPNLENQSDIYSASAVYQVSLEIPGMTNTTKTVTGNSAAPGGTGMPGSPLEYSIPIANENLLSPGEYTGLVAVYDERIPGSLAAGRDHLYHTTDGGQNLLDQEIPAYVTYQTFTATVVIGPDGHISGSIDSPTCPVTGLNNEDLIDFTVSATSHSGNILVYDVDYDYDGVSFNPSSHSFTGDLNNVGPFVTTEPCYINVPRSFTVAFRATDNCDPPNQAIFATCTVTVENCNTDGNLIWVKRAGGSGGDRGEAITTLSDNSTVVIGDFNGIATFGPGELNETILTSAGDYDVFIARYNPDGVLEWAQRAGGTSFDTGSGITTLSDNSIVVIGYFYGIATFGPGEPNETILTSAGSNDIFIARYNPNGTLAWAKRTGGTDNDRGQDITTLSDNSTVLTGYFADTATFGPGEPNETLLTSSGIDDFFIARYNSNGTLAWAKRAGGLNHIYGFNVTSLSDNSTVVTGYFNGAVTFGPGELNETVLQSMGNYIIFIARYNPNGTLVWAKRAGGTNSAFGFGVTTLSDNSTVVAGYFNATATFGAGESNETILTSAGDYDVFIARYNPDGALEWAKRAGGTEPCYFKGITTLSDNSTVMGGYFKGIATFGPGETNETILTSAGNSDIFMARYNPDGMLEWAKRTGGPESCYITRITTLSDNSTVVAGAFYGVPTFGPGEPNETFLISAGEEDIFIARFEP